MAKTTNAPVGLGANGSALWKSVTGKYALRVDELRVLEDACRITDVIALLEDAMADQPLLVKGSMGQPVINPLLGEQKTHRSTLATLLRQLKLPDDPASSSGGSNQNRSAAQARWANRGKTA